MSRRVMDLTSPGGQLRTDEIEMFVNKTSQINGYWQGLANKTASLFLMESGWPFDQHERSTFVTSSLNSKKLSVEKYHTIELSKYGQCHVINKLPSLKQEGPGQGFKLMINIMTEAYPLNEFRVDDEMIEGEVVGIRLSFDDPNSLYFDYQTGPSQI